MFFLCRHIFAVSAKAEILIVIYKSFIEKQRTHLKYPILSTPANRPLSPQKQLSKQFIFLTE